MLPLLTGRSSSDFLFDFGTSGDPFHFIKHGSHCSYVGDTETLLQELELQGNCVTALLCGLREERCSVQHRSADVLSHIDSIIVIYVCDCLKQNLCDTHVRRCGVTPGVGLGDVHQHRRPREWRGLGVVPPVLISLSAWFT